MLGGVLVVLSVFKAFFYPVSASQLASLTSTVIYITTEEWVALARDVQLVPELVRMSVYKIAAEHTFYHIRDNDRKLRMF